MKELRKKLKIGLLVVCLLFSGSRPLVQAASEGHSDGEQTKLPEQPGDGLVKMAEAARLIVDSQNRYMDMEKSYSEGYVPKVEDGKAILVVPFQCEEELKNHLLRISLHLGDAQNMPFVCKNYKKNVALQRVNINDSAETAECYLAVFELELREDRQNGSYPVTLEVQAVDAAGNDIQEEVIIYVTITDASNANQDDQNPDNPNPDDTGNVPDAGGDTTSGDSAQDLPEFAPKVMVQSCQFSKQPIQAGDTFTMDITLLNTSKTDLVKNMTVMISGQGEYFNLLSQTDTIYIDSIPAGSTSVVSYQYTVQAATPQGQYTMELALDYADAKGNVYTVSGKANVPVEQPVRMSFDPLVLAAEVQVADVVDAQIQAMNLGRSKVYNVRAVVEADGLKPEGTIFIGDIEAGARGEGSTRISITSLSEGSSLYGKTNGTVTFYYEDERGQEYTETAEISTTIQSPFSNTEDKEEDKTGQWWVIMAGIGGLLAVLAAVIVLYKIKQRKQMDEVDELVE